MEFPTEIATIVTTENNSVTVERNGLHKLLASVANNTPVIVISVIGCQNIDKTMLLNYTLEFLKAGCNHSWCISGVEKFNGFNLGKETKENGEMKAYSVPITFIGETFWVIILDVDVNDRAISSTLNSKLQLICAAMTNILLYIQPNNNDKIVKVESDFKMPRLQDTQFFKVDTTAHNFFYTLKVGTADEVLPEGKEEDTSNRKDQAETSHDEHETFLKSLFEKSMMVLLPNHSSESLPADFQGQLKQLNKCYKDRLKSFLMDSFSLKNLMEITRAGKCYSQSHDFVQRLHNVVDIINDQENSQSSGTLNCGLKIKTVKSSSMAVNTAGLMKSEKFLSAQSDSKHTGINKDDVDPDTTFIVKELEDCILSIPDAIKDPSLDLFEKINNKYEESLEALKKVKRAYTSSKNTNKSMKSTLDEKIKAIGIEKTCIQNLYELQILIKAKFAEQLYFPTEEFKTWVTKTKTASLSNVKSTRSTEIPPWFELYLDAILGQANVLNKEIRETEYRAIEEAILTALGLYNEKMKTQTDLLIFKPEDLEAVNEKTLSIVKHSLKYALQIENRKNIALDDFDVMTKFNQQASVALEDLKSESMHKNHVFITENATKAASKAFTQYQTQLEKDIKAIKTLKTIKLYEFHTSAKDNAFNIFYRELSTIPKELIEPFSKGLSERIDTEHKRIRDAKVDPKATASSTSPILGIQFGLSEIRFGVYLNGNPQLYRSTKTKTDIPNFIDLTEGICVGQTAKELYCSGKGGFKMELILLENVGNVYDTNVMGTNQKLPLQVIVALIFEYIKSTADAYFNQDFYQCVVSVPNAFDYVQRQMVKDCASMAGFDVLQLISESTAAAVSFRCSPEFKKHLGTTPDVNLLVQCYKSYSTIDSSTIFNVKQDGVKMLSSCSPAFLADLKKKDIIQYLFGPFRTQPTDIQIILQDAIQKSKVEVNYGILIKSGQSNISFTPDRHGITKFCHNFLYTAFNETIVNGTIYYAHEINLGNQFSVSEALQYNVILEMDKHNRTTIERNSTLPFTKEINFALPTWPVNLVKFQGEHSHMGKYSIDARHKPAVYHRGQIVLNFDHSGLLSTRGCLFCNNGKLDVYVTEQTENVNELKKREITEKLKEIHVLEKNKEAQKQLQGELQKEFKRIKNLISQASLSNAIHKALGRTTEMCQEILNDKNSNIELLTQQLKALKTAEETFLK